MVPVFPASGQPGYRAAVTRALRPAPPGTPRSWSAPMRPRCSLPRRPASCPYV